MAGTAPTVTSESFGSMKLVVATFSNIDDGDEWVTNIPNALGYWCDGTNDPTQEKEGIDVSFSAGTFTFSTGENARSGILYVLTKS